MNHHVRKISGKVLQKKLAVVSLLVLSAICAYATLGDGKLKSDRPKRSLLSEKNYSYSRSVSLRSGYTFRGNQVISQTEKYIRLNTVVTYQRGNNTYILPMKKKVMLDKVTFNPNAATRHF